MASLYLPFLRDGQRLAEGGVVVGYGRAFGVAHHQQHAAAAVKRKADVVQGEVSSVVGHGSVCHGRDAL